MASFPSVVDLNVGGVTYTTSLSTLTAEPNSLIADLFTNKHTIGKDSQGRYFIDRDGQLFRFILDYLRTKKIVLPDVFAERERLRTEAEYYRLTDLVSQLATNKRLSLTPYQSTATPPPVSPSYGTNCYITVGYRGSFAFGRDGMASDVKFRKLTRILVSGKVLICREIFGETLNESRDPDHGQDDRYTARYFLKHLSLESAFDSLQEAGFRMVGSCGSGTSCGSGEPLKPGMDSEENRWNHYNEFVFCRP
ncbi:BTB/POZ domain-containing protein KCTD16-like [Oppia nitens]|uniref:BTB/POZ domain-containing protein KCTD16-like n=1 Tax=Oppia nitens TaxID=1686743 RepID=UPI0023DBC7D1|nr:BTB/POZ domain-containing protein KCTD16-like [Oppia nitens]